MKRFLLAAAIALMLMGCLSGPAKFIIPDEPKFKTVSVYQVENGIFIDNESLKSFKENINGLKDYADKMRKILEDQKKEK